MRCTAPSQVISLVLYGVMPMGFGQGQEIHCRVYRNCCHVSLISPASCRAQMKQLVADDNACLCTVINNPGIWQSLNITKTDAVNNAKNCGANADLSVCNNIGISSL